MYLKNPCRSVWLFAPAGIFLLFCGILPHLYAVLIFLFLSQII